MRKYKFLVFLVFIATGALAQNPSSGIIFGAKLGSTKLLKEVTPDFKQYSTEFDNKGGLAADFEISKLFWNHLEAGMDIGLSNISGTLEDPGTSTNKYRIQGDFFIRDLQGPLEYNNRLTSQRFFIGYYFRSFANLDGTMSPEPFVRVGAGYLSYGVELFENDQSTSGKGTENYANLSMSSALFFATAGIKSYLSPNFFVNATYTLNYTNYDYLDAVFNFTYDGERIGMGGLYSEIKIGLFFQTNGSGKRPGSKHGRAGGSLPFSR